jgi:hypothetical protein
MPFDKAQLAQRTVDAALRTARAHGGKVHKGAIHSSVAGRTDHLPMHVASGSYVIPADIISAMGEGNSMAGFKVAKSIFGRHTRDITKGTPYGESGMPYSKAEGGRLGYYDGGASGTKSAPSPASSPTVFRNDPAPTQGGGGNGRSDSYNANQAAAARYAQIDNQRYGDAIPANLQTYLPGGSNAAWGSAPPTGRAMENGAGSPRTGLFSGLFGGGGGNQSSGVSTAPAAGNAGPAAPDNRSWLNKNAALIGTIVAGPVGGLIGTGLHKNKEGQSGFSRLGDKLGMADGGATEGVPIVAAGGEYVIPPEDVVHIGGGDLDHGHKILDSFVKKMRQKTIKTLQNLPGPKKD